MQVTAEDLAKQALAAGLDPSQAPIALQLFQKIMAANVDPAQVATAIEQATTPPEAPDPQYSDEQWATLLTVLNTPATADPHDGCMTVYRAVQTGDARAAWRGLVALWQGILANKTEMGPLYQQEQRAAAEATAVAANTQETK